MVCVAPLSDGACRSSLGCWVLLLLCCRESDEVRRRRAEVKQLVTALRKAIEVMRKL